MEYLDRRECWSFYSGWYGNRINFHQPRKYWTSQIIGCNTRVLILSLLLLLLLFLLLLMIRGHENIRKHLDFHRNMVVFCVNVIMSYVNKSMPRRSKWLRFFVFTPRVLKMSMLCVMQRHLVVKCSRKYLSLH